MLRLMVVISAGALAAVPASAQMSPNCVGTGSFKTCFDSSGNSYSVSKFGNITQVYGSNSRNGTTWNQQSYKNGNTTQTYGTASDGSSWNSTATPYGTYGTDSKGNSFYTPNWGK